jgi:hypothetical protein
MIMDQRSRRGAALSIIQSPALDDLIRGSVGAHAFAMVVGAGQGSL